ncbi:MAG: MBL fold metallo-hydrolase [Flavobacteriales bacterium]|jgi:ribonuclease BN (tRNA processing enzyme)|nr:MBL fold metallo-hydrolase [Flavobacteriales bacterium]|tara:strand:+ start:6945 stop:7694 length:750 start_codon:yes stop_codon:yes gene_type:complete
MNIVVLGSGTSVPRLDRNMSGYLLEVGKKNILFDSGPGTIRQLLKLKVNFLDIDDIFYTHLHNDHINDLPAIIWGNNYGTFRKKALNLYVPVGFKKYFDILIKKIMKPIKLTYAVKIKEMKNNSIAKLSNNLTVKSIKSKHTENSVSYRIEHNNKSIVYSGDSDYSRNIIKLSKNTDLLILECSFPDNEKVEGHLTSSLCGRIAAKANVKKLVLTHFYPECDKVDIKKQCSKEFDGKIILAKDFMKINV